MVGRPSGAHRDRGRRAVARIRGRGCDIHVHEVGGKKVGEHVFRASGLVQCMGHKRGIPFTARTMYRGFHEDLRLIDVPTGHA